MLREYRNAIDSVVWFNGYLWVWSVLGAGVVIGSFRGNLVKRVVMYGVWLYE